MGIDLEKIIISKTDEELQAYLDNWSKFTPLAIETAIVEMQKRGRAFSVEELESVRNNIQAKLEVSKNEENELSINQWKKNVVTDPNAPEYYSERAINILSALFGVFFGSDCFSNKLS